MDAMTKHESAVQYLQADHRRLDDLMHSCRTMLAAGDMKGAAASFAGFRQGLMRHIKIEEELLFPEFEEATGLTRNNGPTCVMRYEHAEIIRLLDGIKELFDGDRPSREELDRLRPSLEALLQEHNMKEERILYPMADQMVPDDRLRNLMTKIQDFQ